MPRSVKWLLLGSVASLLATVPLAVAAYSIGPTRQLDSDLLLQLHRPGDSRLAMAADVIVRVGEWWAVIALLGGLIWLGLHLNRRRETVAGAAVVIGAGVTTQLLKVVFAHLRFEEVWWTSPQEFAFPSGHTTAAAALSVALVLIVPPIHRMTAAAVGILVTSGVAVSVIVLGWHYPSDVLGGLAVVAAWSCAAAAWLRLRADRDGAVTATDPREPRHLAVFSD